MSVGGAGARRDLKNIDTKLASRNPTVLAALGETGTATAANADVGGRRQETIDIDCRWPGML